MKKRLVLLFAAVLALGLAATAFAAETTGVVVKASDDSITVRLDDGTERTYNFASGIEIRSADRAAMRAEELASGQRVSVTLNESGEATVIQGEMRGERIGPDARAPEMEPDERMRDTAPDERARERLPDTASPLPLVAMIGALALAAAFGVRALRRR